MSRHKFDVYIVIPAVLFAIMSVAFIARAGAEEVLTWEDCVHESAKNHPDLIAATEGVKGSEAARAVSASGEYPQVDAKVTGSTSKSSGQARSENYSTALSGSQLVFDGKKTINNVKAAGENIQASKQNYRYTSSSVRQALRAAFVNLLKQQEMKRITQEIFEIRRGSLELITLRYQSGLEHRGALLTAEANLAQAKYGVNSSARDLEVAQRNLVKELGRDKWADVAVQGDFSVTDISQEPVDLDAIAAKNPQVLKLIAQKNAAEFNLRAANGNFAPSLSIDAGLGRTGTSFLPQKDQKSAGFTLNMPLFEGGLRKAQAAAARASLNELQANEKSTRNSVIAQLQQNRASFLESIDNVEVQKKSLLAAEERSKIAEAQYSIGTISFDSWTIIEDNLVSAKRAFLNAQAEAQLAEANWIMAKGETLEYQQ
jgi:outer membrane protein TolC